MTPNIDLFDHTYQNTYSMTTKYILLHGVSIGSISSSQTFNGESK